MTNFNTATNTEYWIIDEFEFFGQSGLTTRKEVEDAGESTPQEDLDGNVYYVPTRFEDGKAYVGNIQIAHLAEGWEIQEDTAPVAESEEETEPTPFNAETAIRLLEQGCVEENEGICITRGKGYNGNYDISIDHDTHLYEVVWVTGYHAGDEIMSLAEVINLIREEAERGAEFYWQVMENNEWERTHAPYLQLNLGESTLAKIRGQKVLLLEDQDVPQIGGEDGFEVVYGGYQNSVGGLEFPRVVVFSTRASFEAQNPLWAKLIEDAEHCQASPFTNLGNIYLFDRPEGGFEIYPREGITREDGSVAEIW